MSTQSILTGLATEITQNVVYALPPKAVFLTSNDAVETSLDGSSWTAQADSVTGIIVGSIFVRCTTGDTVLVCMDAAITVAPAAVSSNPFDQDLNTSDLVQFDGLGIGETPASGQLIFDRFLVDGVSVVLDSGNGSVSLATEPATGLVTLGSTTIRGSVDAVPDNGDITVSARTLTMNGDIAVNGEVAGDSFAVGGTVGIDTTITTGNLVGKTITVTKGLITGFA